MNVNDHDRFRELLHGGADEMQVSRDIPAHVRRAVRLRQGFLVGIASLCVIALSVGGALSLTDRADRMSAPVGPPDGTLSPEAVERIGAGREGGKAWEMYLHTYPAATDEPSLQRDRICIRMPGSESCIALSDPGGMGIGFDYVRNLDRVAIVFKVPPEVDGVAIREVDGPLWAGLVAREGDPSTGQPGFFYRFFDQRELDVIASMEHPDTPYVGLSIEVDRGPNGLNVSTSYGQVGTDLPELRGLPGSKRIVASGTEGGGYNVILRETDDEVCLHIASLERCRAATVDGPVRLALAAVRPCRPEDQCGSPGETPRYRVLTIVGGEVAPGIERVGLRDLTGATTFVQTADAMRDPEDRRPDARNTFSAVLRYRFSGEVVALDGDRELGSLRLIGRQQPDPLVAEMERRLEFLRGHLDTVRGRMGEDPQLDQQLTRSEKKLIRQLRRDERRLERLLERLRN